MVKSLPNISICICTFRRGDLLLRLLKSLETLDSDGLFTYSLVVADNDACRSAERLVHEFAVHSDIRVTYCVESQQNIALARNKALANADGDFVAFIDDDEFPTKRWLVTLFTECERLQVDGVLGPVHPHFDEKPPSWVIKGKFYDRPSYPTGLLIDGKKGRTGNVLLRKRVLADAGAEAFRPRFRTGEDQDFFTRMIDRGYRFTWCHEATVYEVVPPNRWKRSFMLRRALLRGATGVLRQSFGSRELVKSIIAVPTYAVMLPFALLLGQHRFMNVLIRLFDHVGKLLGVGGCNPVREPYVTD